MGNQREESAPDRGERTFVFIASVSGRSLSPTEPELKQELALALFQQERLTLGQASSLAGISQLAFQALMAERRIPIHYGVVEFREDLQALRQTERI
jgi:predicted HTH domain antitoxin